MTTNMLDAETSPYLLQHKNNPVHWQAWSPDILAEARHANRDVLRSTRGELACGHGEGVRARTCAPEHSM